MFWKGYKFCKQEVITYLNRVFLQTVQWRNIGLDIIEMPDDVGGTGKRLSIEGFAMETEKYPSIIVTGQVSNTKDTAFNNQVGVFCNDYVLGNYGTEIATTSSGAILQAIPATIYGDELKGVTLQVCQQSAYCDEIGAGVAYGSGSLIYVTSGSVAIPDAQGIWQKVFIPFNATASLVADQSWTLCVWSDSSYAIMRDTGSGWGGSREVSDHLTLVPMEAKDIVCTLHGPQVLRTGGLEEISLRFRVQAMNDNVVCENIAELLSKYLKLARYYDVNIDHDNSIVLLGEYGVREAIGELHARGIYVDTVATGPEEQRRRGENDIIYGQSVTCAIRTEWGDDVPVTEMIEIIPTITVSHP